MAEVHDIVAGRYQLVRSLGTGGMGRVWRARDEVLHRDVAIKQIVLPTGLTGPEHEELHRRTLREARAAARLNHPNVIQIHDVLRTDGESWIVMEYFHCRSLLQIIREDGPLAPGYAARIGLSVLAALDAAHQAGVVHRDVKPSNVLVTAGGRVVLTDFGVASTDDVDDTGLHVRSVLGSPGYIAPERARDGTSGPRSDLWSLGATLYAAVEGRVPYARDSPLAILAALATEQPDPIRLAGPLRPVLAGLLRKDPERRIGAAEAERLLRRVAEAHGHEPVGTAADHPRTHDGIGARDVVSARAAVHGGADRRDGTDPPSPVAEQPQPRYGRWLAAAIAFLVVLGGAGAVALSNTHRSGAKGGPAAARTGGPAAPHSTGSGAPGSVGSAAPGGNRLVTPSPLAVPADEYRLPEGWMWHHDPDGYRIAAPAGWAATREHGLVVFREPGGGRMLTVGPWQPSATDPVTAWTREEAATPRPVNYQRLRIDPVPQFFASCADWEYSFDGPGGRHRSVSRGFSTGSGRWYQIVWQTRVFDWQLNQAYFWLVTASFRAQ
jgi:hypothetical protein